MILFTFWFWFEDIAYSQKWTKKKSKKKMRPEHRPNVLRPSGRSPEIWVSILLTLLVSLVGCGAVAYHAYEVFMVLSDEYTKGPIRR